MPLWEETCRGHREHEIAFSWILTYGTVLQQVAVLVVQQQVRDRYKLVIRRAEIKSNRRTDAIPLCGVLSPARAPWLLLSTSSCLWHLLPHRPTVQPFSAQGGDNRDDVGVPDATSQAVWASCEIEVAEERYETLLTRFVAMKARC